MEKWYNYNVLYIFCLDLYGEMIQDHPVLYNFCLDLYGEVIQGHPILNV